MYTTCPMKGVYIMDMNEVITNITLTKVTSISPDNESKKEGIKKTINLRVKFDGAKLSGLFDAALESTVVKWANGTGRPNFDKWTDRQTVDISFLAPATKAVEDPMDAVIRCAAAEKMTVEAYVAREYAKRMKS